MIPEQYEIETALFLLCRKINYYKPVVTYLILDGEVCEKHIWPFFICFRWAIDQYFIKSFVVKFCYFMTFCLRTQYFQYKTFKVLLIFSDTIWIILNRSVIKRAEISILCNVLMSVFGFICFKIFVLCLHLWQFALC